MNKFKKWLNDMAVAIKEKTGESKIKPITFPEKIRSIETGADVSGVTATAEDVLNGKKFVDAGGNVIDGTMPNLGSKIIWWRNRPIRNPEAIDQGGIAIVEIEEGYHDGTSGIQLTFEHPKRYTPTKERKRFSSNYSTGMFLGEIDINPIPDQYQDVTPVTATAEDVRAGKVFVDAEGNAVEGALSGTIADVSGVTATAADVRQGKIIVDAQGNEVVGTLVVEQKAPDVIWVGKDSVANAQVGTGVVRYVTFMNDDGTAVYGQKSVLVGTDCIEPVAGGYMDAPTKESTAQYNYTFSGGWATEPGGGINADALKNVTEDRTVYANFIAAVRYYTITYLDSDGTTLLKTESLAYGATPSYSPEKDGYRFTGWAPELAVVTGDASYTASWVESIAFADASWATIAEKSADGTASQMWKVGDTKTVTFTKPDGTTENIEIIIADFSYYKINNSSKYAGLTLIPRRVTPFESTYHYENRRYDYSTLKTFLNETVFSYMPADLQSVVKTVSVPIDASKNSGTNDTMNLPLKVFPLAESQIKEEDYDSYSDVTFGEKLAVFANNVITWESLKPPLNGTQYTDENDFWLRDVRRSGTYSQKYVGKSQASSTKVHILYSSDKTVLNTPKCTLFCFCV